MNLCQSLITCATIVDQNLLKCIEITVHPSSANVLSNVNQRLPVILTKFDKFGCQIWESNSWPKFGLTRHNYNAWITVDSPASPCVADVRGRPGARGRCRAMGHAGQQPRQHDGRQPQLRQHDGPAPRQLWAPQPRPMFIPTPS